MRRDAPSKIVETVILTRIADGTYPRGERVPSVRDLAGELAVNRNTVSKVYQGLQQRGVLIPRRGQGIHVSESPRVEQDKSLAEDRVRSALRETFSLATMMGMSLETLQSLVSEQFGIMSRGGIRIAFIECNQEEAQGTARKMHRALGYPVDPFVLEQLPDPDDMIADYSFISTTLYHLPEVQVWLRGRDVRPIGLDHSPSTESQLAIARLPRGTRIGVVASNERTLNVLVRLVETFHARIEGSCLAHHGARLAKLAGQVESLVTHPLAARALKSRQKASAIVVDFQIQPQSLMFLKEQIAERIGQRLRARN